ncbi:ribosomal RNA small subunit methyltransferase D [Marinobacterium nitratireducens]|uniref:Ribosomal RNA small subunit methyltransferase D n=1 Tax=Marinobacterium nitratireducens TaxID=518897 RepID=A0A917Z9J8_9GAMM|nr:16S rRNA (guanine(966)-N(2))-methyltransferase RsmD [Marinobacterium nitratireducens]GGO77790.1 ribosomal RNA small subunit methyltransferase D [Marinobacterium nitratireducens]
MGRHNRPRGRAKPATFEEGELRIIAGEWRGRRLNFPALQGLRPTPDRVRETLFNWLQAYVPGARCLDLFAGSGALGLEALSRGALSATFVDNSPAVTRQLRDNLQRLNARNAEVVEAAAMDWLLQRQTDLEARYDLVFLDPPFRCDLLPLACELLESRNLLADQALIYIEAESELGLPRLPESWKELRSKTAGQVSYRLFIREGESLPQ